MKISASFLSSRQIGKDLERLNVTDIDYIHVDVMDGKFVKGKFLSMKELKKIYLYTTKRLDVHLMVKKPIKWVKEFALLNTEYITFHIELQKEIDSCIDLVHRYGIKCGLAISPTTPLEVLDPYLEKIELVTVMSVHPGRGGQEFLLETPARVYQLKEHIKELGLSVKVAVDGGINLETKNYVEDADILVSGSYIINSDNFQEAITNLRK